MDWFENNSIAACGKSGEMTNCESYGNWSALRTAAENYFKT